MPHIPATIVSLSQDMDLESGSMANFMVLGLPNGKKVRALISDESAQDIVQLSVEQNGRTIPAPPFHPEVPAPPPSSDAPPADDTIFFGGNGAPLIEEPQPLPPSQPERRTAATIPAGRRPQRVDKDEMGYPVVRMEGAVDPQEVTSARDRDEDGVGQI